LSAVRGRDLDLGACVGVGVCAVCAVPTVGRNLVEPSGEALGEPTGVAEDDGAAMRLDEVDDPLLDRRPDAASRLGAGG
jgi:hypothetical protein